MKTNNLDLAAYLVSLGHTPTKINPVHPTLSEFTFSKEKKFTKIVESFNQGKVSVNLHHFQYCRMTLKTLCKKILIANIPQKDTSREIDKDVSKIYFYIEDGIVYQATFGRQPIHTERKKAGNMYPTRELANLGLKHTPK